MPSRDANTPLSRPVVAMVSQRVQRSVTTPTTTTVMTAPTTAWRRPTRIGASAPGTEPLYMA